MKKTKIIAIACTLVLLAVILSASIAFMNSAEDMLSEKDYIKHGTNP